MIVDYTPEALVDLDVIWDWNARKYGNVHADAYVDLLRRETDRLDTEYARGRTVPTDSTLRYRMIQKKKRRQGHVVARIDKAEAQIQGGNFYTSEQADEELAKRRAEWLRQNPR